MWWLLTILTFQLIDLFLNTLKMTITYMFLTLLDALNCFVKLKLLILQAMRASQKLTYEICMTAYKKSTKV